MLCTFPFLIFQKTVNPCTHPQHSFGQQQLFTSYQPLQPIYMSSLLLPMLQQLLPTHLKLLRSLHLLDITLVPITQSLHLH
jgi:hypothetical protein